MIFRATGRRWEQQPSPDQAHLPEPTAPWPRSLDTLPHLSSRLLSSHWPAHQSTDQVCRGRGLFFFLPPSVSVPHSWLLPVRGPQLIFDHLRWRPIPRDGHVATPSHTSLPWDPPGHQPASGRGGQLTSSVTWLHGPPSPHLGLPLSVPGFFFFFFWCVCIMDSGLFQKDGILLSFAQPLI